jgi:protein-disulfide isomerase
MFCIIAFIVFSILGIFSATHREMAKEAVSCVFRRITLRPCNTGFKEKVKSRLIAKLAARSTFAARVFNRYEEVFSWIFFILMVWSTVWVIRGGVNFYLYGSCNGLNSTGFCLFDPSGENSKVTAIGAPVCSVKPVTETNITLGSLNLLDYPHQSPAGAEDKLVFIGCYSCDYTRKAYPQIQKILKLKPIDYTFIHFPAKPETEYLSPYVYCANRLDPEKFWTLNESIFASAIKDIDVPEFVDGLVKKAGFDAVTFQKCLKDPVTADAVKAQKASIISTGLYGTPTIFINDRVFVGPKPDRVYKRALKGFWW